MTIGRLRRLASRIGVGVGALLAAAVLAPADVLGHSLNPTYTSRLPLAVYLVGAAMTVALSFAFVLARDVRARPPPVTATGRTCRRRRSGSALRAIGLIAWLWIVAQGILGGSSAGSRRAALPVGLRLGRPRHRVAPSSGRRGTSSTRSRRSTTSAPRLLRRLGVGSWSPAAYPARLGRWPACHRVRRRSSGWSSSTLGGGAATLFVVLVGYTAFTLAMMAQFGRDTWRSNGETFTVWFRLLGRLAAYALVDEDGPGPPPLVRERAARARLVDRRRRARRPRRRRRSSSTACRRRRSSSTCSGRRAMAGRHAAAVRAGSGSSSPRRCC